MTAGLSEMGQSPIGKGCNTTGAQSLKPTYSFAAAPKLTNRTCTAAGNEYINQLGDDDVSMVTKYKEPKSYRASDRIKVLSKPRPQYHGRDFFQRKEFRGLFLADN